MVPATLFNLLNCCYHSPCAIPGRSRYIYIYLRLPSYNYNSRYFHRPLQPLHPRLFNTRPTLTMLTDPLTLAPSSLTDVPTYLAPLLTPHLAATFPSPAPLLTRSHLLLAHPDCCPSFSRASSVF